MQDPKVLIARASYFGQALREFEDAGMDEQVHTVWDRMTALMADITDPVIKSLVVSAHNYSYKGAF